MEYKVDTSEGTEWYTWERTSRQLIWLSESPKINAYENVFNHFISGLLILLVGDRHKNLLILSTCDLLNLFY